MSHSAAASVVPMRAPPRIRDSDRTRQQILQAATAEFAAHGLGGARIDAIAERAAVNKKLLYYYFAGKDQLFVAVLEQTYSDIRDAERRLRLEATPPREAIRSLVAFTWQHYLSHPEFLALLNSENMHRAEHLKRSHRIREMTSPLIDGLASVLERGVHDGSVRDGIDAMQLYISIAALSYFYLSNSHTLGAVFDRDLTLGPARAARLTHMCDVIDRYVAA